MKNEHRDIEVKRDYCTCNGVPTWVESCVPWPPGWVMCQRCNKQKRPPSDKSSGFEVHDIRVPGLR